LGRQDTAARRRDIRPSEIVPVAGTLQCVIVPEPNGSRDNPQNGNRQPFFLTNTDRAFILLWKVSRHSKTSRPPSGRLALFGRLVIVVHSSQSLHLGLTSPLHQKKTANLWNTRFFTGATPQPFQSASRWSNAWRRRPARATESLFFNPAQSWRANDDESDKAIFPNGSRTYHKAPKRS